MFIGKTDTEVEAPVLWLPVVKTRLLGKDPDVEKIKGRRSGQQSMSITDSMDMSWSNVWEIVKDREAGVLQSMGS